MKPPTIATFATIVALAASTGAAPQRPGGPGGFGPPGGGPPGMGAERKIVAQFDKNGDKRLDAAERKDARAFLESQPMGRGPGRGGPGRGGMVGSPGAKLTPADVKPVAGSVPLYDLGTVRTLFLDFEHNDWEADLMAFNNTDVEVPATLTVDGKVYRDVGIHFRGASSYFGVPAGLKHSLNVAVDFVHETQSLLGHRTLNLLNLHDDPSYLRGVLFLAAAREHIAAPRANYVRVAINGENWGVYVSAEQFNKDFVNAWYKTPDGARWKVPGSPNGRGGLEYLGDDIVAYKRVYEIKSKDETKSWQSLIHLTKVLNETPADQLERALAPILDVDGALKFLALEATLVNNDGYWTRASDYSIYQSPAGRFHILPHDANETFGPGGGRGMMMMTPIVGPPPPPGGGGDRGFGPPPPGARGGRGGPGGGGRGFGPGRGGPELDPLVGLDDTTKPLRSKLLAVPALRSRYLAYVQQIAAKWLDWKTVGPLAQKYQALIAPHVKADTRKLDSYEAFEQGLTQLQNFIERRKAFLASYK